MSETRRPEPIKVGLVGAGAVAQVAHIPAYRRLRSVELVALCDAESPKLRALRERTGVATAVAELDDLLALEDLDAVDICLPTHLHKDAVVRALEAGKHVLCEKPLAPTPGEVEEILVAQRKSGKAVLVGMNNRYRDDSILLKRFVEDGALGDVFYVRGGWLKRRERIRPDTWHYRSDTAGGGVMMDLGIHLLDLALWLTGYPEVERVSASFWRHKPEIEVEDSAAATVRCAGDLTIAFEASWHFLMDADRHEMRLHGSEGSGLLNPLRVYQRMHGNLVNVTPQSERRMGNIYMESYEREIAYFGEVVAGREETPPLEENLVLARAVEAIRRSAETGREIASVGGASAE
ncbi:MAG: Gfo/Idh/MocA family oxidoreductase [Gemmatimonadetes bacterium]|nr:Gfo/Idh/MocA family oxidoreductase [Gemmatimonadota bacterium]